LPAVYPEREFGDAGGLIDVGLAAARLGPTRPADTFSAPAGARGGKEWSTLPKPSAAAMLVFMTSDSVRE